MEDHGMSFQDTRLPFQVRKVSGVVVVLVVVVVVACRIIVTALALSLSSFKLDFGLETWVGTRIGTWIWDLDLGLRTWTRA